MKRTDISAVFADSQRYTEQQITVSGWIRNIRVSKAIGFIELNDGTTLHSLQVVFELEKIQNYPEIAKLNIGAAVTVLGRLILTPQMRQPFELHAQTITINGVSAPEYPLQNKRHSMEFLRTLPQLRARTNTFNALYRVRSEAAFAIHRFFHDRGFVYVHTPILTGSDCEGAGEMFRVTTLDAAHPPLLDDGTVDFSQDFFGQPVSLTVSGQLEAESMACAFSKVYTFGPTFRAEKSFTPRHAAEFWMIEPEIAFADLNDDMALAQDMIKSVIDYCLTHCADELSFFNQFFDQQLLERLHAIVQSDFQHITYTQAIDILTQAKEDFKYPVFWGCDLQTEHERYLTEKHFHAPVFVTDYPAKIKAFYMRQNDDGKTVAAMDLLVPGVGEIIGGSQREERLDHLLAAMDNFHLDKKAYQWYLDLRRFGTVPHAGFGLGFERLILYLTGVSNIRDVLPFPRTAGFLS